MIAVPPALTAKYAVKGVWAALVGLVVLAAIAFGAWQYTARHGFKFLFLELEGDLAKIERLELELKAVIEAQGDAAKAQQAVNDAAAKIYREVAGRIDDEHEQAESGALAAADRFIAASRVRCPSVGSPSGRADSSAGNHAARSADGAGEAAELDAAGGAGGDSDLVAVPADDVRICTTNTLKAEAARKWALELAGGTGGRPAQAPEF